MTRPRYVVGCSLGFVVTDGERAWPNRKSAAPVALSPADLELVRAEYAKRVELDLIPVDEIEAA